MNETLWYVVGGALALWFLPKAWRRLQLSRAKHRSLAGHTRMALRLSRLLPNYDLGEHEVFAADGAPPDVAGTRKQAFQRLAQQFLSKSPETLAASAELETGVSDVDFTNAYRVPFPFRAYVRPRLKVGNLVRASEGMRVQDLDGNWSYDLGGSYGTNLFGYDFYKGCIERATARVAALGPVLGSYHPVLIDNVRRLKELSGMDEVSFHMSGTEAVMQAVRLARYHTRRRRVVRFCGSYHGWWDGVQAGPGNPLPAHDVYTLSDQSERTLHVLRTRRDIACVLVNPIQAMHPNSAAPSDGTLVASGRKSHYDKESYRQWLVRLRETCDAAGVALIFDDVFLGFRLARAGTAEYFGVQPDLVTYGKSVGGGLPIGVVAGQSRWMRRYRDDRPSDICFARGTFNSHPYVMAAMNEFLCHLDRPEVTAQYALLETQWNARFEQLNRSLAEAGVPVRLANMVSVATVLYQQPSRYNWMFQYYLRAEGLALSWIGTGRFIFSHACTDADFAAIRDRVVRAACAMQRDGYWWQSAELTNRSIRLRMGRELVTHVWRRLRGADSGAQVGSTELQPQRPPDLDDGIGPRGHKAARVGKVRLAHDQEEFVSR